MQVWNYVRMQTLIPEGRSEASQARLEGAKQCILVIIGATPEGKKELLGFTDGVRESALAVDVEH